MARHIWYLNYIGATRHHILYRRRYVCWLMFTNWYAHRYTVSCNCSSFRCFSRTCDSADGESH